MNARGTLNSALDWAARMDRGEVEYNSYIAALAEEVARLTTENAKQAELLGIRVDEDSDAWDEVLIALRTARSRISKLENALRSDTWEALLMEVQSTRALSLDGEWFKLLPDKAAKGLVEAIINARAVVGE